MGSDYLRVEQGHHTLTTSRPPKSWETMSVAESRGIVWMFEEPKYNGTYVIGVDPAQGITGWDRTIAQDDQHMDNSAIQVFRVGKREETVIDKDGKEKTIVVPIDYQVAEYAAPVDYEQTAAVVNALGRLYSGNGRMGVAHTIIEVYPGPGWMVEKQLISKYGYLNFYQPKFINTLVPQTAKGIGWQANQKSVRDLWIMGTRQINSRRVVLRSPWLINEMETTDPIKFMQYTSEAACFTPDTRVITGSGIPLEISEVWRGLHLLNRRGELDDASDPIVKDYSGVLQSIRASGSPRTIRCTPTHLFWGKKRLGKRLGNRDGRVVPKSAWIPASELRVGDWLAVPKRRGLKQAPFSDEVLFALGVWLAEGHFTRRHDSSVRSIAVTNTDRGLLERVAPALSSLSRFVYTRATRANIGPSRVRRPGHKPIFELQISNTELAAQFESWFGSAAKEKSLPKWLFNRGGLLPLVSGFIEGDGFQRDGQQHDVTIDLTSEHLAWQLRQILLDGGVWCTLRSLPPRRDGCAVSYQLNIRAPYLPKLFPCKIKSVVVKKRSLVIEDDRAFYTPVAEASESEYTGPVYDLAMLRDRSFVVEGVAVHNSGFHDDRLRAMMLCLWAIHDFSAQVKVEAKTVIEKNAKPVNWQASDMSADRLEDAWERRFREIGES
jgi:hypothetical protein